MIFDEVNKILRNTTKNDLVIISNTVFFQFQTGVRIDGQILKDCQNENPIDFLSDCFDFINSLNIDKIIAIGGGSIMDLAKILSSTSSLDEVSNNVTSKKYHLTVVPTTFATGSETSAGAIYKSVEGVKQAVRGEEITPDEVIYDPKIFLTLNERLQKESFFDLFTHAFETGLSKKGTETTRFNSIKIIDQLILWHKAGKIRVQTMTDSDLQILCHLSYISGVNLKLSSTCSPHRIQYVSSPINNLNHSTGLFDIYCRWFPKVENYLENLVEDNQFIGYIKENFEDIKSFINYFELTNPISYSEIEIKDMVAKIDENRLKNDPVTNTSTEIIELLKAIN